MQEFSMFSMVSFKLFVAVFFFSVVYFSSFGMPWSNKERKEKEAEKKAEKAKKLEKKPDQEG